MVENSGRFFLVKFLGRTKSWIRVDMITERGAAPTARGCVDTNGCHFFCLISLCDKDRLSPRVFFPCWEAKLWWLVPFLGPGPCEVCVRCEVRDFGDVSSNPSTRPKLKALQRPVAMLREPLQGSGVFRFPTKCWFNAEKCDDPVFKPNGKKIQLPSTSTQLGFTRPHDWQPRRSTIFRENFQPGVIEGCCHFSRGFLQSFRKGRNRSYIWVVATQRFFIFIFSPRNLGKMNPFWLIFFKGVGSTTNYRHAVKRWLGWFGWIKSWQIIATENTTSNPKR